MTIKKDELLKWLREEANEYTSTDDRSTGYHHAINLIESGEFASPPSLCPQCGTLID